MTFVFNSFAFVSFRFVFSFFKFVLFVFSLAFKMILNGMLHHLPSSRQASSEKWSYCLTQETRLWIFDCPASFTRIFQKIDVKYEIEIVECFALQILLRTEPPPVRSIFGYNCNLWTHVRTYNENGNMCRRRFKLCFVYLNSK